MCISLHKRVHGDYGEGRGSEQNTESFMNIDVGTLHEINNSRVPVELSQHRQPSRQLQAQESKCLVSRDVSSRDRPFLRSLFTADNHTPRSARTSTAHARAERHLLTDGLVKVLVRHVVDRTARRTHNERPDSAQTDVRQGRREGRTGGVGGHRYRPCCKPRKRQWRVSVRAVCVKRRKQTQLHG